jgi:hypothetical protein
MPDLDQLLRPDIGLAAGQAAQPFDYTLIEHRAAQRRRNRTVLAFSTAAAAVAVALVGSVQIAGSDGAASLTPIEQPSPRSMPSGDGVLEPGTYFAPRSDSATVAYTVTFPAGWVIASGDEFGVDLGPPPEVSFQPFVVDEIYADACRGSEGAVTKVGPTPQDLVAALLAQPGPAKRTPVKTTLGGYPATRIDLRVPPSLKSQDCALPGDLGIQLWLQQPDEYLVLDDAGLVSVYVVDVDGRRQVFATQYRPGYTSEKHRAELQQVLGSIRIQG